MSSDTEHLAVHRKLKARTVTCVTSWTSVCVYSGYNAHRTPDNLFKLTEHVETLIRGACISVRFHKHGNAIRKKLPAGLSFLPGNFKSQNISLHENPSAFTPDEPNHQSVPKGKQ